MMMKNGMTRYNNDLVRRKDKVKARKADNKTPTKYACSTHILKKYDISDFRIANSSSANSIDAPILKSVPTKQLSVSTLQEKKFHEKPAPSEKVRKEYLFLKMEQLN